MSPEPLTVLDAIVAATHVPLAFGGPGTGGYEDALTDAARLAMQPDFQQTVAKGDAQKIFTAVSGAGLDVCAGAAAIALARNA